jgi:5-methyltetrahydropteroyltriglutamate--homocysteine methyltransferase
LKCSVRPWYGNDPGAAKRIAVRALNRALEGLKVTTVVHLLLWLCRFGRGTEACRTLVPAAACRLRGWADFDRGGATRLDLGVLRDLAGKTVMLGVIDLAEKSIETREAVAGRIRDALKYVDAKRLVPAPDCGMKYLSRDIAFGKLKSSAEGAVLVRAELS